MKPLNITIFGFALLSGFGFLANQSVVAQVVQPQDLNLSGFPTIQPPSTPTFSENKKEDTTSNSTLFQVRTLEAAGLPTNRPSAVIMVSEDGKVKIKNAVVFQIIGNTFFARTYWNEAFIRWTIRTNDKTQILKKFSGPTKFSEIVVGHELNIDGTLLSGSDTLNIDATFIRDLALENESASFKGRVTKIDINASNFTIATDAGKFLTIKTDDNTIIKKGLLYISLSKIVVGDKVISVNGNYHQPSETILSTNIEIYQEQDIFISQNFQGIIKGLSGTALPVMFKLVIKDKEYSVNLIQTAEVLKANRTVGDLKRFVDGDTVRIYGKIRDTDLTTIDAEVIRNLNL